jgi:ribosomal protein L27
VCAAVHRGALPPSAMRQRTKQSHGAGSGEGEGRRGSSLYAQEEGKVQVNVVGSRREIRAEFG